MSHYTKIRTRIVDRDALLKALADLGYPNVEVHNLPVPLLGYLGDERPELAEIVIRRHHISSASNDIGFRKTVAGTYEVILSEYDTTLLGKDWTNNLCQAYAYHAVSSKLAEQGFTVSKQEVDPTTKKIHLILRR